MWAVLLVLFGPMSALAHAHLEKANPAAGTVLHHAPVTLKALSPGRYRVLRYAVSTDTHRIKGQYSFTVGH